MKVIVKGIMCEEDALLSIKSGADSIWISNSCNFKSKSASSTISVLPSIAKAVKSVYPNVSILMDSGIRRGTDVMKCLAYGADGVFINRPIAWSLTYNGEEGVGELLCMLNEEVRLAMALTHCFKIKDITQE